MFYTFKNRRLGYRPSSSINKKPVIPSAAVSAQSVAASNAASEAAQQVSIQKETAARQAAANIYPATFKSESTQKPSQAEARKAFEQLITDRNGPAARNKSAIQGRLVSQFNAAKTANNGGSTTGNSNTPYYDVDKNLAEIRKQALEAGVSLPKPPSYGNSVTNAKRAQAIIDGYVSKVNAELATKHMLDVTREERHRNMPYFDVDKSLSDLHKQALDAGVSLPKPPSYGNSINDSRRAQTIIDDYVAKVNAEIAAKNAKIPVKNIETAKKAAATKSTTSKGSASYFDVDKSLADIYKQAQNAGVSLSKPSSYGTTITDSKKAQSIIDDYTKKANAAITAKNAEAAKANAKKAEAEATYDVASQYNEIYNAGKGYGVTVNKPTQTQFKTQAAAQAALDSYVAQVNKALENAPAPTFTNVDPQKTSGYAYTVTMSHAQQNKFIRENQTRKQQGKPELTEYEFRKSIGLTTETTSGSYVKPKITNRSYSSNGTGSVKAVKDTGSNNRQAARIGSGDIKLAEMKVATKGNAANNKPTVISAAKTQQLKAAAIEKKQVEAKKAAENATQAKQVARDAKAEATAKAKQVTAVKAQLKNTVNEKTKTQLKKEIKTLEKASETAKIASKAADAHAKSTSELADATKKAATVLASPRISATKAATVNNAVKKAEAKAAKTSVTAEKIGVQDHTGQILLKDGTWVSQVQRQGGSGKGEGVAKVFGTTKEYQKQLAEDYRNKLAGKSTSHSINPVYVKALNAVKQTKRAEAAEAKRIAAAYVPVLAATGEVIDAIQSKSLHGTGEANLRVIKLDKNNNIIAASKTAQQLHRENKLFNKPIKLSDGSSITLDKLSITPQTNKSTAKLIQEARAYKLSHTPNTSNATKTRLQMEYLGLDGQLSAPKSKTSFKTKDQIRQAKLMQSDNKLASSLVKADVAFREAGSWKNVKGKTSAGLASANKKIADAIDLPTLVSIENSRDQHLAKINVKGYNALALQRRGQKAIYGNQYGEASMNLLTGTYESVRTKPVSAGLTVAAMYATGMIAGVAVEGVLGLAARGAAGIAVKASSKAVKKAAIVTAQHVQGTGRAGLGLGVAAEGLKTVAEGDAAKTVNFAASLAVGGFGYSKGAKTVKDPISILPNARTTKLQAVSSGHDTAVMDIRAGETFSLRGKPILSRTREGKFVRGAPALDSTLTKNKVIQSFDKSDTATFRKTLEKQASKEDVLIFDSGKKIASVAYNLRKPVTGPKKFEILSENIPSNMKPVVKDTIVSSKNIEVYGSVAQKLQMEGFFSRVPQDIEVSTKDVNKFVSTFKTKAAKSGYKEGTDYRIRRADADSPKIEFKINGKWEKGIEVFASKNSKASVIQGYRSEDRIAFGFNSLKPLKVDSAKLMKLQEQAARKHAGATTLQDGTLKPVHPGRSKDIRDLIEIGVANEVTFKTGIAKEIIQYAKLQAAKGFDVGKSPVATHLVKHERMPTMPEFKVLTSGSLKDSEISLLARRVASPVKMLNSGNKGTSITVKSPRSLRKFRSEKSQKYVGSKASVQSEPGNTHKAKPMFRQGEKKSVSKDHELLFASKATSKTASLGKAAAVTSRSFSKTSARLQTSKILGSKSREVALKGSSVAAISKSLSLESLSSKAIPSRSAPSKAAPSRSVPSKAALSKAVTSKSHSKPSSVKPSSVKPTTSSAPFDSSVIIWSSPDPSHWHLPIKGRRSVIRLPSASKGTTKGKKGFSRMKFHRNIRNTLGGMSSMFEDRSSSSSAAKKKPVSKVTTKGLPTKTKIKLGTPQSTPARRNSFKPPVPSNYSRNSRKLNPPLSKPSNSKRYEKEEMFPSTSKIKEGTTTVSKTINSKPPTPSKLIPLGVINFGSGRKSRGLSDVFNFIESTRRTENAKRKKLKKADNGKKKNLKREKFHRNIKNTLGSLQTFF